MGVRKFEEEKKKGKGQGVTLPRIAKTCVVLRIANPCPARIAPPAPSALPTRVNLKESKDSVRILFLTVGSEIGGRRGEKPYLLCAKLIIEVLKVSLSANLYTLFF